MIFEVTFWIAFILASRAIAKIYYRRRDVLYGPYRAARGVIGPFDQGSLLHNQEPTHWRRFGRLPGKADARSDKP
jgi:hypothetical protein